ncbi:hypothetical protein DSM107133_00606 [Pseudosulfitobacter sp. DSM 107133]|nr:hypothetical protein DSM107133_00606 [Pseudosulfitobacter sp. DSM 107133]
MHRPFGAALSVLAVIALAGCESSSWRGGETTIPAPRETRAKAGPVVDALCQSWGESLPTRSHQDTAQTTDEIEISYTAFGAACPEHTDLVPE